MLIFNARKRIQELTRSLSEASEKISGLERQNSQIQAIIEGMVEGVIAVAKDTRILSINPRVEKIFGIAKKDAEGRILLEAIRNNDIAEIIDRVLKDGKLVSSELTLVWPIQGTFQVNASPIFEKNKITGCLLVIHDITEIRKLEKIRSDFVANASHELKTPLTSIRGFVETLLEGALDDRENSRNFLEIIQNHTERLNNLINDLLDLSYMESREATVKPQAFMLKELLEEIILGFRSQFKKKAITIKEELPAGLSVNADRDKIGQVFTNLIDNAVKFNRQDGLIRITCEDLGSKVKIVIEDSGAGIPPKDIPRIFERFYRADKARSSELGGTGLGLAIVKHIIELHGGETGVESIEGAGSKFWFTIPK